MRVSITCVACAVSVVLTTGCMSGSHKGDTSLPPPQVKIVTEETFSGHDRIVATGVDEYISRYHNDGWLRALHDDRLADTARTPDDKSTKRVGSEQSIYRFP